MLPITEYPSFVREAKSYLESGFDDWRQVENAMRYLTGLVAIPERKNVSSINRSFLEYRNQVSMNSFITDSTWDDGEFRRAMVQMVKDEVEKQGVMHGTFVIDDTFLEKSGEEMEAVGWFWDHSHSKSILAHNLVSTHYIAGRFYVPLDFDVYVKRKDCADKKRFRTKVERLDAGGEGLSFYVTNMRFWKSKKVLQTQAMRWPIEGFHRDAKQSLGLEDYQVRNIRGVKRHIATVFFAYILLQFGSGFDSIMGNLKANLRTLGSRCRLAGTEVLSSLIRLVVKMSHRGMDTRKIMDLLTKPLERSGYWV